MVASFISRNLCRLYLYRTHEGLAVLRESDGEECHGNWDEVVEEECTRLDSLGHNSFFDWVQVFVQLVQVFVGQERELL